MTELADRYRRVAADFGDRVQGVPDPDGWDRPSPCEGWVARDVVVHLVEWVPPFLASGADVPVPPLPDPHADPVAAWTALDGVLRGLLDDPASAGRTFDNPHTGAMRLDEAIGRFVLGDVLVHTWDLARATGQDETLEPDEVAAMVTDLASMGDVLEQSGHYKRRVDVPDDADPQTKLIALTGRAPSA